MSVPVYGFWGGSYAGEVCASSVSGSLKMSPWKCGVAHGPRHPVSCPCPCSSGSVFVVWETQSVQFFLSSSDSAPWQVRLSLFSFSSLFISDSVFFSYVVCVMIFSLLFPSGAGEPETLSWGLGSPLCFTWSPHSTTIRPFWSIKQKSKKKRTSRCKRTELAKKNRFVWGGGNSNLES